MVIIFEFQPRPVRFVPTNIRVYSNIWYFQQLKPNRSHFHHNFSKVEIESAEKVTKTTFKRTLFIWYNHHTLQIQYTSNTTSLGPSPSFNLSVLIFPPKSVCTRFDCVSNSSNKTVLLILNRLGFFTL